jgi:hypothetical protein
LFKILSQNVKKNNSEDNNVDDKEPIVPEVNYDEASKSENDSQNPMICSSFLDSPKKDNSSHSQSYYSGSSEANHSEWPKKLTSNKFILSSPKSNILQFN